MKRSISWILLFMELAAVPLGMACSFQVIKATDLPPEQSNLNSYTCACDCGPESRTRSIRVAATADDSEERIADGVVDRSSLVLDFVANNIVGLRFQNVGIPAGSVIQSAKITAD